MSVFFHNRIDGKVLANPGTKTGRAFYYLAEAARSYIFESTVALQSGYTMPVSTGIVYGVVPDELWIDPSIFCGLVELIYLDPSPEFYYWALHAATLVEGMSGKQYYWEWSIDRLPSAERAEVKAQEIDRIRVEPILWPGTWRPEEHSRSTIGPYDALTRKPV